MSVEQVQDLAALRSQEHNGVRFVRFHTYNNAQGAIQDEGGGVFEWVASVSGSPADNNGTIIKPNSGYSESGRWVRQVDVRGVVHPEWWGFQGDGTGDDFQKLVDCLTAINIAAVYPEPPMVQFLGKTYRINDSVLLQSKNVITGEGVEKTIIQFYTNDWQQSNVKKAVFGSDGSISGAVVRDLTIDCQFNEKGGTRTRQAIELVGPGNLVQRVRARNFGTGYDSQHTDDNTKPPECFVISLVTTNADDELGAIEDCIITEPGWHTVLPATGYSMPEITCLNLAGPALNKIALGGRIARNRIIGLSYYWKTLPHSTAQPYQPSMPHCITVANCKYTEITNNEIINCDGVGVYIASWTDENVVIRKNRMINVNAGVAIGVIKSEIDQNWEPKHTGMLIEENVIILGRNTQLVHFVGLTGVFLSSDSGMTAPPIRLSGITVRWNFIRGGNEKVSDVGADGQPADFIPTGIIVYLMSPIAKDLVIEDNILETPATDDRVAEGAKPYGFAAPYENALIFYPRGAYNVLNKRAQVRIHGNRNLAGADLPFKVWEVGSSGPDPAWGHFSDRVARFFTPSFDGAARVYYDEFLGQLPRSALGWEDGSSGGTVEGETGQDGHPGIVKLKVSTQNQVALLQQHSTSIVLDDTRTHIFQFLVMRSDYISSNEPSKNYECRMGLMSASGNDALCFLVSLDTGNGFVGLVVVPGTSAWVYPASGQQAPFVDADPPVWHTCRIEVLPEPTASISLEARFFFDGVYLGSAFNRPGLTQIPTAAMSFGFQVKKLGTGSAERSLLVDYFQHQIL